MTTPQGYHALSVDHSRAAEVLHVDAFAFAFTVPEKDAGFIHDILPWDRTRAIEVVDPLRGRVGTLAAVHASFAFKTRVPGGREVATAGLSWVGVHPGHRRRGLLRAMIHDHFSRSLARGEVISTLFAAETQIYQRFGYGLAATEARVQLGRGVDIRPLEGSDALSVEIDSASLERHGDEIRSIQSRMARPGTVTTLAPQTLADILMDLEIDREGGEELRIAVVRDGADPVAWALFQRKGDWGDSGPDGKVRVRAWGALDAASTVRLWGVLVDFDLMATTYAGKFALDDPLLLRLKDIRSAKVAVADNLWVRILDVAEALQARGYAAECDVTIHLEDAFLPLNAGVWRIHVASGEARVTRDDGADPASADLRIDIQELGAAYLGGTTITELLRAGLVDERTPGTAAELSRAMASDIKPVANFGF
ncbi:GNAT family N-acetyltransferase [Demequina muriae]|uniref:GNAT family N-acetyltransferase n=1 Tax=Demequina muriae TaxID=3051664 RepID=A0ABT8GEL6_9MICO|nr:GNAT family N-acetyltransferase [Demequina sp. EGI L300058]MDN4479784.1 GNAT family N-acetyltransferase [Demequina sp. EGI L300058]